MGRAWRHAVVCGVLAGLVIAAMQGHDRQSDVAAWLQRDAVITLYFAAPQAAGLVAESRWVSRKRADPVGVLQELVRGPLQPGSEATLPQHAVPRRVTVEAAVAVADFSPELVTDHPGGSAGEILTVFSIVHTLTALPDIERVQILIAGEPVDTLVGHLDLSRPLTPDPQLNVGLLPKAEVSLQTQ